MNASEAKKKLDQALEGNGNGRPAAEFLAVLAAGVDDAMIAVCTMEYPPQVLLQLAVLARPYVRDMLTHEPDKAELRAFARWILPLEEACLLAVHCALSEPSERALRAALAHERGPFIDRKKELLARGIAMVTDLAQNEAWLGKNSESPQDVEGDEGHPSAHASSIVSAWEKADKRGNTASAIASRIAPKPPTFASSPMMLGTEPTGVQGRYVWKFTINAAECTWDTGGPDALPKDTDTKNATLEAEWDANQRVLVVIGHGFLLPVRGATLVIEWWSSEGIEQSSCELTDEWTAGKLEAGSATPNSGDELRVTHRMPTSADETGWSLRVVVKL